MCLLSRTTDFLIYLNLNLSTKLQLIGVVFHQSQVGFWAGVDFLGWHTSNDIQGWILALPVCFPNPRWFCMQQFSSRL